MEKESPLVDKDYLVEKFPGKGGWTYVQIPEVPQSKNTPFGWVRVRGLIDSYEIQKYNLQPLGNGTLFLPIKAEIRKKIKKQVGDRVHVTLYADNVPIEIPEELSLCFIEEPHVLETFTYLKEGEKKTIIEWIYSAKTEKTKVERIVKAMNLILTKSKKNE